MYICRCVVVAIILAILCAYSLWKKRRTLCGWGFNEHHAQSEGDSAGSCYAPPQYSRCNSFHHPPPPYTEVSTSTCDDEQPRCCWKTHELVTRIFRHHRHCTLHYTTHYTTPSTAVCNTKDPFSSVAISKKTILSFN